MKKIISSILGLSVFVTLSASDVELQCKTPIQSWSNLKKMRSGDFSANVLFKDVKFTKNSVGYGPGKNRQYEISILDGKLYMARPAPKGATTIRHNPKKDDGAAMLQVANVNKWGEIKTLETIETLNALNFELDYIVSDSDCESDAVLPFKIIGFAKKVKWSMDTDNQRVDNANNVKVTIEGIYTQDTKSRKKYFMVKGTNTHPHVILTQKDLAGHLKDIVLNKGAKLYLPIKG